MKIDNSVKKYHLRSGVEYNIRSTRYFFKLPLDSSFVQYSRLISGHSLQVHCCIWIMATQSSDGFFFVNLTAVETA